MIKKLAFTAIIALAMSGCAKEEKPVLPYVKVNVTFYLNDPQYQSIQNPATAIKITRFLSQPVGYLGNGIIVFHEIDNSFYAYDATCTNSDHQSLKIVDGIFAQCPGCETKFSLINGYAAGNGSLRLQRYDVMVSSSNNQLTVYN